MIAAFLPVQRFSTHESSWRNISKGKSMCKLQDASETFYRPLLSSICARTHRSRENIHPQQHSLSCPLCVFDSSLSATPSLELSLSIFSARPVINERHADREGESDGQEDEANEVDVRSINASANVRGAHLVRAYTHTLVTHWYYASEEETQEQLMRCQQQWLDVLIQDDSG